MVQKGEKLLRIGLGLQARLSSRRLPNKIFFELEPGFTILDSCLKHAHVMKSLIPYECEIALLVPTEQAQIFEHVGKNWDVKIVTGSEDNVLRRYENFQKEGKFDYIVRLTADCPFVPAFIAKQVITETIEKKYDYGCTKTPEDWFDGADVEIFTAKILSQLGDYSREKLSIPTREHVTWPLKNDAEFFALKLFFPSDERFKDVEKLSIDTLEEFQNALKIRKSLWWI